MLVRGGLGVALVLVSGCTGVGRGLPWCCMVGHGVRTGVSTGFGTWLHWCW